MGPNLPSEKLEFLTALRPLIKEIRIGIPYEQHKHIVAQPVKELNAAVDPKYIRPRSMSITVESTSPQSGMSRVGEIDFQR